ncbi:hypothetical protein TIFTF001_015218 [Ficus carica]|uniref:Uncharacterized protein n=1 Tax=Ficus carica TaxID=3494 RepID=A0AA88A432_FICCA|nr:hypothetical protein TIFTF001_015218 [Ficus carica]
MSKISGTTPNVVARTRMYLYGYSVAVHQQKWKHLEVIGTSAFSAGSDIRVTQSGRPTSIPRGGQVAEVGDVMCSNWLCVRRQASGVRLRYGSCVRTPPLVMHTVPRATG